MLRDEEDCSSALGRLLTVTAQIFLDDRPSLTGDRGRRVLIAANSFRALGSDLGAADQMIEFSQAGDDGPVTTPEYGGDLSSSHCKEPFSAFPSISGCCKVTFQDKVLIWSIDILTLLSVN
jgi:hypothetical protein